MIYRLDSTRGCPSLLQKNVVAACKYYCESCLTCLTGEVKPPLEVRFYLTYDNQEIRYGEKGTQSS